MEECKNNFYHNGFYQITDLPVYCDTCGERVNGDGDKTKFEIRMRELRQQ